MKEEIKVGRIYQDINGVRFVVNKIDRENDYIEVETYGSLLFDYGYSSYSYSTRLTFYEKLLLNKKIFYWGDD